MWDIFRRGFELVKSAPAVIVPVLIFLVVSELMRSPAAGIHANGGIGRQILEILLNPAVLAVLGVAFVIKMISVFFSNADMYLAYEGRANRYKLIMSRVGVRWLAFLVILSVLWTGVFCLFGLAVIIAAEAYLPFLVALTVIAVIALPLFPLYYLGISLGSLIAIAARLDGLSHSELLHRVWSSRSRVYGYYALRSVIDQTVVVVVPVAIALLVPSKALGLALTIILITLCVSYIRASFMAFKRDILLTVK
ncbi:MAG TPA: hypothetical protein VGB97_03615 [Candidatus Paceibacterota bacterium]|jgi:hypothetical protein